MDLEAFRPATVNRPKPIPKINVVKNVAIFHLTF